MWALESLERCGDDEGMLESEEVDKAAKKTKALIGDRYANYLKICRMQPGARRRNLGKYLRILMTMCC
jgi:hypothetical protein